MTTGDIAPPRTTGIRRAEGGRRGFFVALVTEHVIAKLVALLFAGVIIVLIDRELTTMLLDAEFDVRIAGAAEAQTTNNGGRRVILLEPEPGVTVQALDRRTTRVTINGLKKFAEALQAGNGQVGHVVIKSDWLTRDSQGVSRTPRKVEGTDVDFGIPGLKVSLTPSLQIELDPEIERELKLVGDAHDVAPGLVAEVTYEPPFVRVLGPQSWFRGRGAIDQVNLTVSCAGKTEAFTDRVTVLPDELVQKQVRLAPGQQITARVAFRDGEDATLDVDQVPLKTLDSPGSEYTFAFQAPLDGPRPVVTVKLTGNREAVARYRGAAKEELRAIKAWINTDTVVAKLSQVLTDPSADPPVQTADVRVMGVPADLKVVGVTPDKVDVKVRKK